MGPINQEWKNVPLGSLYSELWQLGTIWRNNSNVMKISAIVQNCHVIFASQSNLKNKFGNILNFFWNFSKNQKKKSKFSKTKSKFKKFQFFLKMFPKLFFKLLWLARIARQFCTIAEIFITFEYFLHIVLSCQSSE